MLSQYEQLSERVLNEFASYYKRLIRVERYLKKLIYDNYTKQYANKTYKILYESYFSSLREKTTVKDNAFKEIYKSQKTDNEKFVLSLDKMYISEVLAFFSHRVYLKNIVRKTFFDTPVKTNKNDFRITAKHFKDFRNCVCHFDVKRFLLDKRKFVSALLFFEKLVNCKYRFASSSIEAISHNVSITSILKFIYQTNPEYFEDDRILVNVFDDIARLLDFRTDNLPQYKSIIRQKFKIEGKK